MFIGENKIRNLGNKKKFHDVPSTLFSKRKYTVVEHANCTKCIQYHYQGQVKIKGARRVTRFEHDCVRNPRRRPRKVMTKYQVIKIFPISSARLVKFWRA